MGYWSCEKIYEMMMLTPFSHQKLFKQGFGNAAMKASVPLFAKEVEDYLETSPTFNNKNEGIVNVTESMSEITIYTASSSLQGREVRSSFDSSFSTLYRHLDDSFIPINFILPGLPLPVNRRRDHAQRVMEELYGGIIARRRVEGNEKGEVDMIWNLMDATYKDGSSVPDKDIARLMIALLMGGQHNTAASGAWILLHLANKPEIMDALYQEQVDVLGMDERGRLRELDWDGLQKLTLNNSVIKETLRLHSPIHSILRQVKSPMPVPGTNWVIPPTHTVLACPTFSARLEENFPNPLKWDPYRWQQPSSTLSATSPTPTTSNTKHQDIGNGDEKEEPKVDYGFGKVSKAVNSPYLPFGAGRHRCVGEQYAYAQLGGIVASLVREVRFEQVDAKAEVPKTDFSVSFDLSIWWFGGGLLMIYSLCFRDR